MCKLLVIGYGNTLRGDDGVGCCVAAQLSEVLSDKEHVEIVMRHQLMPELSETMSHADLVVFVDACKDRQPGQISVHSIEPASDSPGAFTHNVTPASLLASTSVLYGATPAALLISVAGENFAYSETLSPAVQAAIPAVIHGMQATWDEWSRHRA